MYVTPTRYRSMRTGLDLSSYTDAELQAALTAASDAVNAAISAPAGYTFLGGTVTDEEHQWRVVNRREFRQTEGRIWPYMRPLMSATALRIQVTKTQYIDFTDEQLFVQHDLGYVEPVAAPSSMALFTSVPPWTLTSPVALLDYTYGFNLATTDELLAAESGGTLRAGHQFWYTDEEVVLKKNGVVVDVADYEIDYDEGVITPDTPDESATWKASYHHKLPPGIAAATTLVATDMFGAANIAASGLLGLSGIKVEEVEMRQSSKVNFFVTPVNAAAKIYLAPYAAMFTSMR